MPDFTDPQIIGIISTAAALVGTIIGIVKAHASWRQWKRGWKQRIGNFFDDWEGRPARPGVDAEPGVMERLKVLEDGQASQGATLATQDASLADITLEVNKVKQQVQNSHVTNMRDDIDEVIGKVDSMHEKLDEHLKPGPTTTINVHPQETSS